MNVNRINELTVDELVVDHLEGNRVRAKRLHADRLEVRELRATELHVERLVINGVLVNIELLEGRGSDTKGEVVDRTEGEVTTKLEGSLPEGEAFDSPEGEVVNNHEVNDHEVNDHHDGEVLVEYEVVVNPVDHAPSFPEGEGTDLPEGEAVDQPEGRGSDRGRAGADDQRAARVLAEQAEAWAKLAERVDGWFAVDRSRLPAGTVRPAWARWPMVVFDEPPEFTYDDEPLDVSELTSLLKRRGRIVANGGKPAVAPEPGSLQRLSATGTPLPNRHRPFPGNPRYERDYIRVDLLKLGTVASDGGLPFIISGVYLHSNDAEREHVTFADIRPFCRGYNTLLLCDHLNLHQRAVAPFHDFGEGDDGRRWFLIVKLEVYLDADGVSRGGVSLGRVGHFPPVLPATAVDVINRIPLPLYLDVARHETLRDRFIPGFTPRPAASRVYTLSGKPPKTIAKLEKTKGRGKVRSSDTALHVETPQPRCAAAQPPVVNLPVSPLDAAFQRELSAKRPPRVTGRRRATPKTTREARFLNNYVAPVKPNHGRRRP